VDELAGRLRAAYEGAADPVRAASMAAYMRDLFPFLGIGTATRRGLDRELLAAVGRPVEDELTAVALACWALDAREYQYFACDRLKQHAKVLTPASLPVVRELVVTKPWWDTVDVLAAHVVGPMVARHPVLVSTMDEWAASGELWLIRTAILHQLRYKGSTDVDRLGSYCGRQAGHKDFFVRKAIGWALREYAKTDPGWVRAFVAAHPELSGLSRREALKNL
jgi:3-methyladenine DNA glycosylase AlkD